MPRYADYNDLIGKRSGKLFIEEYLGKQTQNGKEEPYYKCRCDCGNETIVKRRLLVCGHKRSCGDCIRIEKIDDGYRYLCKDGDHFEFSIEDYETISELPIHINCGGYPMTKIDGKDCLLTHYLIGVSDDIFVDHIDGNPRNNRRENLRFASSAENARNMALKSSNTSGFKGVSYFRSRQKYRATIKVDYKQHHLGYYERAEDAARAYDEAARYFFGEFACVNFPQDGEQGCLRDTV